MLTVHGQLQVFIVEIGKTAVHVCILYTSEEGKVEDVKHSVPLSVDSM